jgi:hypothetical protein
MIQKGKNYLVRLTEAPTIEPKEGGWVNIRYSDGHASTAVSTVLSTKSWTEDAVVHIFALANGPDPQMMQDELVYGDKAGNREARTIMSCQLLDRQQGQ